MKIQSPLFLVFLLLLTACATPYHIASDYESQTNFQQFKSYNYLNHNHNFPLGANPINKQRIERAIESELANLGYQKTEEPDLLISWFVTVKNVTEYDYYREFYGRWHYITYQRVYEYQEGTLVVDIIDRASNQVVWHGKTSDQVYEGMPDVEKKIKKAVNAMFKQYAKDSQWKKKDMVESNNNRNVYLTTRS